MNEKIIEKLKILAVRETWTDGDDFCPCDRSDGNYDDAYYSGTTDGETLLARELLKELFPNDQAKKT